jgi:LmbE family N-acetylglucosaminyl deacetylase
MRFRPLARRLNAPRPSPSFFLRLLEPAGVPKVLPGAPPARQVVVLAPHPDDEVIGCGGVLRLFAAAGVPATVIFMSDGRSKDGHVSLFLRDKPTPAEERVVAERKGEAARAGAVLGVSQQVFLDLPDGGVRPTQASVLRLAAELDRLKPDIVFLPFLIDQHSDHFQTNVIFLEASKQLSGSSGPECWAYEIWTPLLANRIVDITAVADAKWQALEQYASQTASLDYVATTRGLNAYRSIANFTGRGFAEAFFACPLATYRALYQEMGRPK